MGNCFSGVKIEEVSFDPQISLTELDKLKSEKHIKLSENPQLFYSKDRILTNRDGHYGGKIYYGFLSKQLILLKLIDPKDEDQMIWEEKMLSQLCHENIARIFYPFRTDDKCFLLMEFVGQNIKDLVGNLDEFEKKTIMLQLTNAVSYLQENHVVHLGLSPQNVYVLENLTVKLINFQNALKFEEDCEAVRFDNFIEGFSAPEVMSNYSKKIVYYSTDIYSLGCLFFYITSGGYSMIQVKSSSQVDKVAARLKIIKDDAAFEILFKDVIRKMLAYDPVERIPHNKIKDHPCFWTAKDFAEFIIDTGILIEKDAKYYEFLTGKSQQLFETDWTEKLEDNVVKVNREIRLKTMKKITNQDDINVKSAGYLVKIIRNSLAHATDDRLVDVMGTSKEDLMKYWNGKFPKLIMFLYNCKIQYDYNCEIRFT